MDEKTLTGSDALSISAMTDRNRGDFMNDGLGIFFIFALLMMNNGWNGFGGRGPVGVSEGDLATSQAAQTTQLQMSNLLSGQQIQQLSAQMNSCCCEIKTQMLQDRLDEAERRNVVLQNSLDNANQSQYILGQLGRFVAWAGSGSQAAATAAG